MKAYHFLKEDMCGGYGNEPAWKIGEQRELPKYKELIMCQRGYHASPSFYEALNYAKGNMACIVEISGKIIKDTDKYVAQKRKLIDAKDAEKVLRTWACDCAERALKKTKLTDKRSWNAIKIARLYNEGKATKKQLNAARVVAWDAAWDAAWAAARASARDAVWAAARASAWDAAWDAAGATAWDAAWAAAGAAAEDAEIKWQKRHLNKLMKELFNGNTSVKEVSHRN